MLKITLKAARVNAGLTMQQVEDATGYTRKTLGGWETGKVSPRMEALQKLCNLYGIPLEYIVLPERQR